MRKILSCTAAGMLVFGLALAACGGGGGGGSTSAFCDTLKKDKDKFDALSDSSDLNSKQSESAALAAFNDLVKKAPSEIKGDMQKLADGLKQLETVSSSLESAFSKGDFEKASSIEASASNLSSDFEKASKNVEKFAKDKCGIDLTSGSSDSSSSSSKKSSSSRSSSSNDSFSSLSDFSFDTDSFSSLLSSLSDFSLSS